MWTIILVHIHYSERQFEDAWKEGVHHPGKHMFTKNLI